MMRLANEIEELFDFAVLPHRDAEARRAEALAALPFWIEWARALGVAAIADELASIRESVSAYQPLKAR